MSDIHIVMPDAETRSIDNGPTTVPYRLRTAVCGFVTSSNHAAGSGVICGACAVGVVKIALAGAAVVSKVTTHRFSGVNGRCSTWSGDQQCLFTEDEHDPRAPLAGIG